LKSRIIQDETANLTMAEDLDWAMDTVKIKTEPLVLAEIVFAPNAE